MVVQHNLQAMNANRMLGITAGQSSKSTEKLSSGYRINRAADDAAGLAISEKMRKQMRGLSKASSNAEDGISCVQTAEGALAEVQDMLQRMNELCVQAANGTNSITDRQYIQDEIDQMVVEIDRVSETTKFNELYLLKGDEENNGNTNKYITDYLTVNTKNDSPKAGTTQPNEKYDYVDNSNLYVVDQSVTTTSSYQPKSAKVIRKGDDITEYLNTDATNINTASYAAFRNRAITSSDITTGTNGAKLAAGDIYIFDTEIEMMYHLEANDPLAEFIDDDDRMKERYRICETYSFSANDIKNNQSKLSLYDSDGNAVSGIALNNYFDDDGNYTKGLFKTAQATTADAVDDTATYVSQKITKVANALEFDLHVGADSNKENKITTSIISISSAGIGIDMLHSNKIGIVDKTGANATSAVDVVAAALQEVSKQRSALGAVQNRLEHTVKNLDNVVENTTAAESQIRDTNMAEEMVKYSNNNILLQAGQSMLAQANQSNQGVLSLLQG